MAKKPKEQLNSLFENITYKYQLKQFRLELKENTIELKKTRKAQYVIALCLVVAISLFFYLWLTGTFQNAIYDLSIIRGR